MSLVVHKLVLKPGGAITTTTTAAQANTSHHVTLSAYTHSHHRSNATAASDNSNSNNNMGRVVYGPSGGPMNTPPASSSPYSSSSNSSTASTTKHSSTYNLPFVLQDHNYGAPPPPTPPHSPPPAPPPTTTVYQYHHHPTHHHHHHHTYQSTSHHHHVTPQKHHHHHHHASPRIPTNTPTNTQQSATSFSSPSLSAGGVVTHHAPHAQQTTHSHTHHPLPTMPPHRQQFMPHPKATIFPSPHIPPPPVDLPSSNALIPCTETDDDSRLSDRSSSVGPSGEETETAPEGEGDDLPADDSITRCVCDFSHDDGYMIQCDRCFVWQHVDCMEIDRNNIPDEYLCEACDPRPIDRFKARALQIRRRQEIKAHLARLSSSDSEDNIPMSSKRGNMAKVQERKVVKKKKVKQIKDMKNGRKGAGGSLLMKKGTSGAGNNTTATCNNTLIHGGIEEKDRRILVKRRRKSNSQSGGEGVSDDSSGGGPVERLRAWVEGYEAAVTNHYSPELRARVHAARINGVSPDLRASTQGAVLGHRCRVANNPRPLFDVFDSKILVAATRLAPNTAITEFQGKYLLASQWNAQHPASSQPYLPYVLQYHMPKEGLTVCVDARTYGNDARFTRHSCTPNAEVRHVVERGSLHLYIVSTQEIEEGEEVTLSLDTANSSLDLVCCMTGEHECQAQSNTTPRQQQDPPNQTTTTATTTTPSLLHKRNGLVVGNKKTFKKQPPQPQPPPQPPPQLQLQLRTSKRTSSADTRLTTTESPGPTNQPSPSTPVTTVKQRRASGCGKSPVKSPSTASTSSSPEDTGKDLSQGFVASGSANASVSETPRATSDNKKMTREERKIAAYMKAFERMEKAAQRRQEMEKKKEEDKCREVRDKEKKRCDGDEEDWEKTSSADECMKSNAGIDRCRRKGSKKGRGKGTSPQKRSNHRADSAASDLTGDESSCASVGLMSPSGGATIENITLNFNSPPQGSQNPAMGFRFPKTKKALMNEWLNENVDPVVPVGSVVGSSDLPSGVPPCYMRSPAMPLRRSSLNQTTGPGPMPVQEMPGGSAKKRWLRQAISEETETPQFNGLCPSPNSRPDSPTAGGDYITPLKKRRLARESMSSELSSTPPSTPVHSTSMEEDKMVEEMEAELAEEEESKTKTNHRYSDERPTSPSAQDGTDIIRYSTGDETKAAEQDEEEEEEEDLIIDEDRSFLDQGTDSVSFVKCGGRKPRRVKRVTYKDDACDSPKIEDEDEGRPKRRQVKKVKVKRGKRQVGGLAKKGKQDRAKGEVKRRRAVKRGKEASASEEEELEEQEEETVKVEDETDEPETKEEREPEIKTEPAEQEPKVEPKTEEPEQEPKEEERKEEHPEQNESTVKVEKPEDGETEKIEIETETKPVKIEEKEDLDVEGDKVKDDSGIETEAKEEEKVVEEVEIKDEEKEEMIESKVDTKECEIDKEKEEVKEEKEDSKQELEEVKTTVVTPLDNQEQGTTSEEKDDTKTDQEKIDAEKEEMKEKERTEEEETKEVETEPKEENPPPVRIRTKAARKIVRKGRLRKGVKKKVRKRKGSVKGRKEEKCTVEESKEEMVEAPSLSSSEMTQGSGDGTVETEVETEDRDAAEPSEPPQSPPPPSPPPPTTTITDTTTTTEAKWKLDLTLKTDDQTPEIIRKPPTPPTLFPPLPWQTNPENFADTDPLRPKTPEPVNFLGLRGPRTPEGPAPTTPSTPTTPSPPSSPKEGVEKDPTWTPRLNLKGPSTPPPDEEIEPTEEGAASPSQASTSASTETHSKPAPVKKKLSILEYRKRKSVGGETAPHDTSPPPCPPPQESTKPAAPPSPTRPSSPLPSDEGDSSPDLPLSPMGPILLPPSPIGLENRTKEDAKKESVTSSSSSSSSSSIQAGIVVVGGSVGETSSEASSSSSSGSSSSSSKPNALKTTAITLTTTTATTTLTAVGEPATTIPTTTTTTPTTTSGQDNPWNAAPTLLERQRENLTARLRREFGLCVADDEEEKAGVVPRVGCPAVPSRPSPPIPPLTTPRPHSPRAMKPLTPGGLPCMTYLMPDGEERTGTRRHKNIPPPPVPPLVPCVPPPTVPLPTVPPPQSAKKNSLFHGREVMEPKSMCSMKVAHLEQPTTLPAGQRLHTPPPIVRPPQPLPPPPPGVGAANPLTTPPPRPCPRPHLSVPPPVASSPAGLNVLSTLPALPHGLPTLPPPPPPPTKPSVPCLSTPPPIQSSRPYSRGAFTPSLNSLTTTLSLYSAARLAPPPPPPPPVPQGMQAAQAGERVSGDGSASFTGQDCSTSGTRGS